MLKVQKSVVPIDKSDRRRGRPAGKNRKPLSLEERRARNAQYERERRNETADAMAQLAEAACCNAQISNAELLATVISQLQRRAKRKSPEDIEELKRANQDLESQIAALHSRLAPDGDLDLDEDSESDCIPDPQSDSSSNSEVAKPQTQRASNSRRIKTEESLSDFQCKAGEMRRCRKIRKTSKSSSVSGAYKSETEDQSDSDSESDWSNIQTAPKQYQLRQRRSKLSEESDNATTNPKIPSNDHETETSQNEIQVKNEIKTEDLDQNDDVDSMNVKNELTAILEQNEFAEHYDDMIDTTILDRLTEDDKQIINEWINSNENFKDKTDQGTDENKVKTFLDFDNFLLDINA